MPSVPSTEDWLSTILIDHLLQTTLKGCVPDHVLIGSSDCYSYFSTYNDKLDKHDCADAVQTMRGGLKAYARSEFRYISAACHQGHYFVVDVTFDSRQPAIFQQVNVYDSLSITSRRRATAVLGRLQRFLSGFCFHGLDHNLLLLEKQDYIVQRAVFRNCPKQNNSHDCGLFAIAVIWHLLEGKEIHSSVFTQDHIGALREALYRGLSSNAEWATLENVSSFFLALLPPVRNEPSLDQDGALKYETGPEVEEPKEDEEVVAETHPENFIHDVEDEIFERKFSEPSQVFQTVEELMVVINDYQETSGNSLAIRRSRGSSRAFACISHANCSFRVAFGPKAQQEGIILKRGNCNLRHSGAAVTAAKDGRCLKKRSKEVIKELANDVALHKHAPPTANDVLKAGVHKKKTLLSYKQSYRGVNARNESKIISDPMSFQLVGLYVEAFAQRNPGSTAFMERRSDNRIQRVFVCPSFANDVLMCVRPVISIDGAHMRSEWKGTLYLATVQSAGDDLYPVAFAIPVDGEDFQGWLWFLQYLKASAPNLIAEHFRRECSYKLFTFMSDRCKGLTTALGNVFPANHNCYCAVHIRRNVESNHGKKFASMVTALSETTSLPEKRALLTQLQQKSPGAYKYVTDINANRWMDSAWLEDEKLPPRYGFRNSNISESANNMFYDARNGNWLDAIDGILIKLPPRYKFRNSNISESANNMFYDARNGNWLDAIDGILIKMSLRITKSQSEYEGKDGVVDNILGLATKHWENCVGCRVYASGNDSETYSVYQKLGGGLEEEALLKVRLVDCVCDCGKWQAIGVPCVHGMAYSRHQMKWRLEDVLDQAVDEYYKYRNQRELYRRNFVPVWRHLLEPDMMTLLPDGAARRMPGRRKTVRLRKNSRYAHEPEKSPTICSRCHQPGHNVRTCVRREAVKKRNAGNGAATISHSVL
ncbi:MULE transposase domain containing protein [Nitzschia inconspicua]|uniref:MULE transposase domain containing protein n=1 Tax=Nitzschia inconspicua TaxID=303405 RepID=A0A9K3PMG2_9STRA|nr:MULE transposase domain containing protein [Nitzschia inconspicua]